MAGVAGKYRVVLALSSPIPRLADGCPACKPQLSCNALSPAAPHWLLCPAPRFGVQEPLCNCLSNGRNKCADWCTSPQLSPWTPASIIYTHNAIMACIPHTHTQCHYTAITALCPCDSLPLQLSANQALCPHGSLSSRLSALTALCPHGSLPLWIYALVALCPHSSLPSQLPALAALCPAIYFSDTTFNGRSGTKMSRKCSPSARPSHTAQPASHGCHAMRGVQLHLAGCSAQRHSLASKSLFVTVHPMDTTSVLTGARARSQAHGRLHPS